MDIRGLSLDFRERVARLSEKVVKVVMKKKLMGRSKSFGGKTEPKS